MSSDIPDVELELVVGEVLDVEALGGSDGADVLNKVCSYLIGKRLQDGGLACVVKAQYQNTELLFLLLFQVSQYANQAAALCVAHCLC